jgi:hypothetical protein
MADPKTRLSSRLREAIRLMVEDGLTRAKAAETAGMTDHALYCALRKPHVRALRRELVGNLRESAASRTIARAESLADGAESEHVRNDANKWLASLDPDTSPIARSESTINHKGLGPGLVIVLAQPETAALPMIGGKAQEVPFVSREKHLSAPVPHPAMVNGRWPGKSDAE